ncbi:MAG: ATP-dependent helicase [Propioniciclava sp.]
MTDAALSRFSPATRTWFESSFSAPTAAQAGAWEAISSGHHSLVVAPTGSGKTLAAFLWALDRLTTDPAPTEALRRCRVLYVSPLKALAVDVERNLRSPLIGIGHAAERLGLPRPEVTVSTRSGDTTPEDRRRFARAPSDILITTPESLYLLLTSQAREALRGVHTVIVDEVHAVAGTKRGAHLALSLERLDALLEQPAQRVGLSATVRPVDEVARFLAGGRPVTTIAPPSEKEWDLSVEVPVPDLGALDTAPPPAGQRGDPTPARPTIWPHVEERLTDLIAEHRSTLVFTNSRRLAETLTSRLNEIAEERATGHDPRAGRPGLGGAAHAINVGTTGYGTGAAGVIARAHHGSVSHEQRADTEEALKAGLLPAVVATSSLELGIDMGAVDLVVQVEAPPSVASGLQRVGRAGHQVGAVSRGIFFPKYRGDLVASAVTVERMRAGAIEAITLTANPLDVLAQHIVAMVALEDWAIDDLERLVRSCAPFATLTRGVLEAVVDMLAGRYPAEEFAELRPRLVWDRVTGLLTGRRGAQRIAVTSGGTIPDRGLFGVFLAGDGPGRRVGELDEEMVYESRVGDVITLGTSTWRIEEITHDQVQVTPAPGEAGRLPFWKGDTVGRPAELGEAIGGFLREIAARSPEDAHQRLAQAGLDRWAADNLLGYLTEQRQATGQIPTDTSVVVETFTDELGDWRVVVHSPYGAPVHAPWALVLAARLRERYGVDVQAMHSDDGIVCRIPDTGTSADLPGVAAGAPPDLLEALILDPDEVTPLVTQEIGGSALFASRFRECAGRALLLPSRRPGHRQALWQQRQRAAALLEVASQYPAFPIVLEAVRECLQDVYDVPGLITLLRRIHSHEISVTTVTTTQPSPFASSLMFGYVAQYLYEGDSPLAERRAAALSLDPELLAELLGTAEGLRLRDLLDPAALVRTEAELQHLSAGRRARDADEITDLLRRLGPLSTAELQARSTEPDAVPGWLTDLTAARRAFQFGDRWAAIEDAGRLRDALGVALPPGVPHVFTEPADDPFGDLLVRYARTHAPFTAEAVATWLGGLGLAVVRDGLHRLVTAGRLVTGEFTLGTTAIEFCDPGVLRTIRRRSVAALRAEVEPVPAEDFARFLPAWHGVGGRLHGVDGTLHAVEQLAGVAVPASALESLILPVRVRGYQPQFLDELCAAGEVIWMGHGSLSGGDGWVSLWPTELIGLASAPQDLDDPVERALLAALTAGGAQFFGPLTAAAGLDASAATSPALWGLVWKGLATNDTLAPLRARLAQGTRVHRTRPATPRGRYARPRLARTPRLELPQDVGGRWSVIPADRIEPTPASLTRAEVLLDRYGVLTRGSVQAEEVPGGFAGIYRVLSAAEEAGRVRRGYFVEGLGAAQFGTTGAVDRLRGAGASPGSSDPAAIVLAACDPAQPYGAALAWPSSGDHRPGRKAGALVILVEGGLIAYLERGGRTALTWTHDPTLLAAGAAALAGLVHSGSLPDLSVTRIDGDPALTGEHPFAAALLAAGFHQTPQGVRLRAR